MRTCNPLPAQRNRAAIPTPTGIKRLFGAALVALFALLAYGVSRTQAATFIKANNASALDGTAAGTYLQDNDNGAPTTTQIPGANDIVVWDSLINLP